jgi:hypothetical protein
MRLCGLDIFGADEYGPLSPEQLSKLDRVLTPAEQKSVDDWQTSQSNAAQKTEETKGGPTATITVTPKGAVVTSKVTKPSLFSRLAAALSSKPKSDAAPVEQVPTPSNQGEYLILGGALLGGLAGAFIPRSHMILGALVGVGAGAGIGFGVMKANEKATLA